MKDLTQNIMAFGEAKANSERMAHEATLNRIEAYRQHIMEHSKELDTMIANANAARTAGIRLSPKWDSGRHSFEKKDFDANGIVHRLGFVHSNYNGEIVGMGVFGGGWDGNVSVVYQDGEVFYDTDKYYDHDKVFQSFHPLDSMSDNSLGHYEHAFKTFASDIAPFGAFFEEYLESIISGGEV